MVLWWITASFRLNTKQVYLSLGSNLGDRQANLHRALAELENHQIHIIARSSIYETEPQGVLSQRWFLNMTIACETRWFPLQLLSRVQRIERELGRVRSEGVRGGPRAIDIDILLFAGAVMDTAKLVIPHPRMLERRFVLEPLLEIAPGIRDPRTGEPLSKALSKVAGQKATRIQA